MFKMGKQMKEERKEVIGASYEHGNMKVEEADIRQRWRDILVNYCIRKTSTR